MTRAQNNFKQVALVALWYDDNKLVLVKKLTDTFWEIPCTRVAEGETLLEAAQRAALFAVGVNVQPDRFGRPIRTMVTKDDVSLTSMRANLTEGELEALRDFNPSGTKMVMIVPKCDVALYLTRKRDRAMLHAGKQRIR